LVDGSFLLPKLAWLAGSRQQSLQEQANLKKSTQKCSTTHELETIDLLDICRLRATDAINREVHPLADVRRSFQIRTTSDMYLFEAPSNDERDRIVYGLKLVVARLASLLMLRDFRAAEEFFGAVTTHNGPSAVASTKVGDGRK
jgi:hypothetical protein